MPKRSQRIPRRSAVTTGKDPRSAGRAKPAEQIGDAPFPSTHQAINPRGALPFLVAARRMWINRTIKTLRDFPLGNIMCRVWFPGDSKPVADAFAADAEAAGLTRAEQL